MKLKNAIGDDEFRGLNKLLFGVRWSSMFRRDATTQRVYNVDASAMRERQEKVSRHQHSKFLVKYIGGMGRWKERAAVHNGCTERR